MRPLTLTLAGFRSHEGETAISFEDRSFVAIVGPTGAGKSSILDAVAFALYGKTPRIKSATKRLICLRAEAARVRLRFVIEKDEYEITRVLRRSGGGEHVLEDMSSGERTTGDAAVTEKVVGLLGLDFEAFCSSVLLAQGKFARFLEATATEQMKILKGVFRLDQVDHLRDAAKARVAALDLDLREIEGEKRAIPDDLAALMVEARRARAEAAARVEELRAALASEGQLLERRAKAVERRGRAEDACEQLARLAKVLPPPGGFEELARRESDFGRRLEGARAASAEADAAAGRAADDLAALEERLGTYESLVGVRGTCAALARAEDEIRRLIAREAEAKAEEEAARGAAGRARAAVAQAKEEQAAARAALASLQQQHAAHLLRRDLRPGESCPVCEQAVPRVPPAHPPESLAAAEEAVAAAEAAAERAAAEAQRAEAALVAAAKDVEHATHSLGERRAASAERRAEIEAVVGHHDDPRAEVEARCARLEAARRAVTSAVTAAARARDDVERLRDEEHGLVSRRGELATALVHAAGALGEPAAPAGAAGDELALCAASLRNLVEARIAAGEKEARAARAGVAAVDADLAALRARLGLAAGGSIGDAHAEAKAHGARLDEQIAQLDGFEARAGELAERERTVSRERTLYARLADDLTDRKFIKFLLEDRRRLLSELGSLQLRALTGRYRFDDELEFNVVDELDGDKLRDIETLSGGELFLASLALALGLADAVSRHGGRLGCFFLDEGFGSLDPESLDLALDGIEQIVRSDRLIVLVSHVQPLAHRVEDKIVLERTPEGMSLLRGGGGAP